MSRRTPPLKKLYTRFKRSKRLQRRTALMAGLALLFGAILVPMFLPDRSGSHGLHYHGAPTITWLTPAVQQWHEPIDRFARQYDLDADLVAIIITLESNGNPQATSEVGAQGLMQVMPATAGDINRKFLATPRPGQPYDLYDPTTNIEFGTAYLAYLRNNLTPPSDNMADFIELIAAGYNGGPGAAGMLAREQAGRSSENVNYATAAANLWQSRYAAVMPAVRR